MHGLPRPADAASRAAIAVSQRLTSALPLQLRRPGVPLRVRAWITRRCGAAVVDVCLLPGASSMLDIQAA
jgi:hypothetical protein